MVHVARVDEDLVVLLVPVIDTVPVESDVLAELGCAGWRRLEPPRRVLDHPVTHPEVIERSLTEDGVRLRPIG